jgi:hypothetical protein
MKVNRRFGGTCRLHFRVHERHKETSLKQAAISLAEGYPEGEAGRSDHLLTRITNQVARDTTNCCARAKLQNIVQALRKIQRHRRGVENRRPRHCSVLVHAWHAASL